MTPALKNRNSAALASDRTLEECLSWSRGFSVEFPVMLANHLPMVLVAMHRMGASEERLRAYCAAYERSNGLVAVPAPIAPITPANFSDGLGDRRREADFRLFFSQLVA